MLTKTSKGDTFDASTALVSVRNGDRLMMDVMDTRPIGEIAPAFEGVEVLTQEDAQHVEHSYRGYTVLAAISRNRSDGSVRVTLEKP